MVDDARDRLVDEPVCYRHCDKASILLTSPAKKGARSCPQRRRCCRTSSSHFLLLLLPFQLGSRSTPHPAIYSVSGERTSPSHTRPAPYLPPPTSSNLSRILQWASPSGLDQSSSPQGVSVSRTLSADPNPPAECRPPAFNVFFYGTHLFLFAYGWYAQVRYNLQSLPGRETTTDRCFTGSQPCTCRPQHLEVLRLDFTRCRPCPRL